MSLQQVNINLISRFSSRQDAVGFQGDALLHTHKWGPTLTVDVAYLVSPVVLGIWVKLSALQVLILVAITLHHLAKAAQRLGSLAGRRAALT